MSISNLYPEISPSLLLDFANVKALDPRVTFSRASGATYYDGKTVAKAEENLVLYSQEFDNAAWVKLRSTVTANATIAPDGTTTADSVTQASGQTAAGRVSQTETSVAGDYVFSCFAKPNGKNFVVLLEQLTDGSSRLTYFDLQNGTVGTTDGSHTATITASTEGFYRCSIKFTATARSNIIAIYPIDTDGSTTVTDSGGIYIWGAQLEQRDSVTAYTRTTNQPITNYIPVLQTASANVARFDHDPVTGESKGLLIEEQRTNLVLRSEDFASGYWAKGNLSVVSNAIVAPDGTLTMSKLVETTGTGSHRIRSQNISLTQNTTYTVSFFAKKGGRKFVSVAHTNFSNWSGGAPVAFFNLDTGVVVSTGSNTTAKIENVGNGVYRCLLIATFTAASTTGQFDFYAINDSLDFVYTGDGYSGIYVWGAQLEVGGFPTSYIKTEASQVTRSADSASMTGTNFSDWYRADEGTLYGEYSVALSAVLAGFYPGLVASFDDGTNSNAIQLYGRNNMQMRVDTNGGNQLNIANQPPSTTNFSKTSIVYKANDCAISTDDRTPSADSSVVIPTVTILSIGARAGATQANLNGHIKKLAYYPQRLSNEQLQALTS